MFFDDAFSVVLQTIAQLKEELNAQSGPTPAKKPKGFDGGRPPQSRRVSGGSFGIQRSLLMLFLEGDDAFRGLSAVSAASGLSR